MIEQINPASPREGPVPLPEGAKARRVYLSLFDAIASGRHVGGSQLPGEQKLAQSFAVSRVTVRRALDVLCANGLVERQAGRGTVVCNRREPQSAVSLDFTTLLPQVAEMGRNTTARLLSFDYDQAPAEVCHALALEPSERVQIATRVRYADDLPFSCLVTYVPEHIAGGYSETDLASAPLFELLERSGVVIQAARQTVSATLASPELAESLQVAVGSALLTLKRVVFDSKGQGVEYLLARYRPDRFHLDMELTRVGDASARQWQPVVTTRDEHPDASPSAPERRRASSARRGQKPS